MTDDEDGHLQSETSDLQAPSNIGTRSGPKEEDILDSPTMSTNISGATTATTTFGETNTSIPPFPSERTPPTSESSNKHQSNRSDKARLPPGSKSVLTTPSKKRTGNKSPFFSLPSPLKSPRPPAGTVSCIEVPPLWDERFGLIQEEFAHDPFKLLVAVIFLNKTRGKYAIPVFRQLIELYPEPGLVVAAGMPALSGLLRPLGLQTQRAKKLIKLAQDWMDNPPVQGSRHRTLNYPMPGCGKDIKPAEVLADDDPRPGAWEVGHFQGCGLGPYAYDSWRIFCRDELRGLARKWNGEGAGPMFEPEWKRVLPKDKELRVLLRWMWLKEGFVWDPVTGDKEPATEDLMARAIKGGLKGDVEVGADPVAESEPKPIMPEPVQSRPKRYAPDASVVEGPSTVTALDRGPQIEEAGSVKHGSGRPGIHHPEIEVLAAKKTPKKRLRSAAVADGAETEMQSERKRRRREPLVEEAGLRAQPRKKRQYKKAEKGASAEPNKESSVDAI
jgi:methyl-CpG-binding domain protein 4